MSVSLKDKTIKGLGWSAVDKVAKFSVTFVIGIILARLLSPDDFGLLGLTTIFTTICNALINGGFVPSLIRKIDATEDDYNTVFIINMMMSVILIVAIFFVSPYLASFFNRDELTNLIRVLSLGLFLGPISVIPSVQLNKRIEFKIIAKISIVSVSLSGLIGIGAALYGWGVWSLVVQTLSHKVIEAVLTLGVNRWIPQFKFSSESFKELFGFGWKLMLSNIIDSIWAELNHVVVGKFYSPATLGQYTRSKQFSYIFSDNLTAVIQRVTYPVLSSIQDDKQRLLNAYRGIIKTTMFFSVIGMFLMGAMAEPLLNCLIGSKWSEAAAYLPLICISGSIYPLQAINLNLLQVQGRSDLFLGLEIVKKTIAVAPLLIGAFVGIFPMLYTNLVVCVITFFLNSHYSGILIDYSSIQQIKDVAPSYGIASLISIPIYCVKFLFVSCWIALAVQIIMAVIIFFLVCIILKPEEYKEIIAMHKSFLS